MEGGCSVQLQQFFHQGKERTDVPSRTFSEAECPGKAIAIGMERRGRLGCSRAPTKASKGKFKLVLMVSVPYQGTVLIYLPQPLPRHGAPHQPSAPDRQVPVQWGTARSADRLGESRRSQS